MKNEEIIKELRDVIDCIANEEPITATRTALTIIEKLKPKPLFVLGPAKLRNGLDAEIYKIFDDCIHGYYLSETGKKLLYFWGINGLIMGNSTTKSDIDLLPNNESEEK